LVYRLLGKCTPTASAWKTEIVMLVLQMSVAIYVLNAGYAFEGSCTKLGEFEFTSNALSSISTADSQEARSQDTGNRFIGSVIADVPIPLPKNYVLGMDVQKKDFENFISPSYLGGRFQDSGWWYYYLYASTIKVPLGTWLLLLLVIFTNCRSCLHRGNADATESALPAATNGEASGKKEICIRDHLVLLLPPVAIFILVSSQSGFSHHFRYVMPSCSFFFIWVSQIGEFLSVKKRGINTLALCAIVWLIVSSLATYPHTLSYFNELAGGPRQGHNYLINSNIDWGQDLWELKRWLKVNQGKRPLRMAYCSYFDAAAVGLTFSLPPRRSDHSQKGVVLSPGLYAISVNFLRGFPFGLPDGTGEMSYSRQDDFSYFLKLQPIALAGYSIYIYEVDDKIIIPLKEK
jgi:hypothetical protein